jgi:Domain of unknown function (DUF4020)
MGRVVLVSNAHYLLWVDPDWTRANLLPLFDWDRDALQAVQAWHGFLIWGRTGAALLEEITASTVQLASHLEQLGGERDHYGKFIARAALSIPDDPLGKTWFQGFLANANDDDRANFAWEIDQRLQTLLPEKRAEIWRDWLKRYLERRARLPPPPKNKEVTALLNWPFSLPEQLAELVERVEALPSRGASIGRLLWRLQKGELASRNPDLLVRLMVALLRQCEKVEPWDLPQLLAVIRRLGNEGAQKELLRELIEGYLEHGGRENQELMELL